MSWFSKPDWILLFVCVVTCTRVFRGRNEVVAKVIFLVACVKNSVPPPHHEIWSVNVRLVHILLECILVHDKITLI